MKPAVNEKTGKPLPYRQQPREFQVDEAVKGITGFVLCDRSDLTLEQKVDWYVERDATSAVLDAEARAEVREKILLRLQDGREIPAVTAPSPSWALSRYVRTALVCRDQRVNASTVTTALINQTAANMATNGRTEINGYDARAVRAILLDKSIASPYPAQAPAKYAGK